MISLIPKIILPSVGSLTPQFLRERGLTVLLLDFDNTILPYTCDEPTQELLDWFRSLKDAGVRLCVLSNTKHGRAVAFCERYGIDCITHAQKPFQRGVRRALEQYREQREQIALVGDQIYTDVLCANTAGIVSVLITPLHLHNIWLKLRHLLELPWIAIGKWRQRHA